MNFSHLLFYKSTKFFFTVISCIFILCFCKVLHAFVYTLKFAMVKFYPPAFSYSIIFNPVLQEHSAGFLLILHSPYTAVFASVFLVARSVSVHLPET